MSNKQSTDLKPFVWYSVEKHEPPIDPEMKEYSVPVLTSGNKGVRMGEKRFRVNKWDLGLMNNSSTIVTHFMIISSPEENGAANTREWFIGNLIARVDGEHLVCVKEGKRFDIKELREWAYKFCPGQPLESTNPPIS